MDFWHESSMNATEYKKYHESLMENNHGSTALHTFFSIFFTVKCALLNTVRRRTSSLVIEFILEYITIVLPLILAHTLLAQYLSYLNFAVTGYLMSEAIRIYPKLAVSKTLNQFNFYHSKHIHSISCLRGLTYLITVFAILAVDFKDFPRNLAKTERYGFSLMDTGVGLFVLMSGLVHKKLERNNYKEIIKSNTKFLSILVCLGVARFWSVKSLDYQEHVTEYGVHWNFFFTLAVCKLGATILLLIANKPLLLSILTLTIHECLLYYGLQDWVFSNAPRTNLISANREGISSCLGYTSLYLFAVYVKQQLSKKSRKRLHVFLKLAVGSIILWFLLNIMNNSKPISRTLANASYCLFVCATIVTILSFLYLVEALYQEKTVYLSFKVPIIVSAANDNGLIFFLVANLLTGAINMSIRTLFVSSFVTFGILNCYMLTTTLLAVYLQKKGIKI